jgi:hypothetical protein
LLKDDIKQGLKANFEYRFLLIKPSSNSVKMAAFRGKNLSEQRLNSDLERSLTILTDLIHEMPTGKIEIRVVDYIALYTMYIFDPQLPNGHILAHLSTFHVPHIRFRPTFKLTHKDDRVWFEHFLEQFEVVWNEAEPYQTQIQSLNAP